MTSPTEILDQTPKSEDALKVRTCWLCNHVALEDDVLCARHLKKHSEGKSLSSMVKPKSASH